MYTLLRSVLQTACFLGEMHEKHKLKQEFQFDFFLILVTRRTLLWIFLRKMLEQLGTHYLPFNTIKFLFSHKFQYNTNLECKRAQLIFFQNKHSVADTFRVLEFVGHQFILQNK